MYVITGPSGVFIVDTSVSPERTEEYCKLPGLSKGECKVKGFLLTHGHYDHIKFINEWMALYPDAQVFFSSKDAELMGNAYMNCSYTSFIAAAAFCCFSLISFCFAFV